MKESATVVATTTFGADVKRFSWTIIYGFELSLRVPLPTRAAPRTFGPLAGTRMRTYRLCCPFCGTSSDHKTGIAHRTVRDEPGYRASALVRQDARSVPQTETPGTVTFGHSGGCRVNWRDSSPDWKDRSRQNINRRGWAKLDDRSGPGRMGELIMTSGKDATRVGGGLLALALRVGFGFDPI